MNPGYPVYIVSKGRWESRLTVKGLEKRAIPYKIVIEPQEYDNYAEVVDPANILTLPFGNLGQGSIPARNWIWEHAISKGAERHWILDDNIRDYYRRIEGKRMYTSSGTTFKVIEDFVDRYENIALAGMQYKSFVASTCKYKPVIFNTRIYSCILIKNDIPFRWRGRYNEDTDLSIRVLKAGWVTALFYAFMADKIATMTMKGGNSDELYKGDGRLKMAQSLIKQHPDVTTLYKRWGRWQHLVDYSGFKSNKLIKKEDVEVKKGIDNYGMKLEKIR
jgi:hypothetical protein